MVDQAGFVSHATRANFAKLAEELEALRPGQRELEWLVADAERRSTPEYREWIARQAEEIGASHTPTLKDPLPGQYPARRSAVKPDAWLRAGAPPRPLVPDPAGIKRELRMVAAIEALLDHSKTEAERQAERDVEHEARVENAERGERRWKWWSAAIGIVAIADPVVRWAGDLIRSL